MIPTLDILAAFIIAAIFTAFVTLTWEALVSVAAHYIHKVQAKRRRNARRARLGLKPQ